MKKQIFGLGVFLISITLTSCNDFLTLDPLDTVSYSPEFWDKESNIRLSTLDFYTTYFPGYRSGWSRADWFADTNVADWTDDIAQLKATFFTKVAPVSTNGSGWNFDNVRALNLQINSIEKSALNEEAKKHWLGVSRLLRGMEYASLVEKFGDVPYYADTIAQNNYNTLYKARDPRTVVMDKVLDDFNFAVENIRVSDGKAGLTINKDVARAFASRFMLFEGTWQKYREKNNEAAKKYLMAAKNFAESIMNEGKYKLCNNYKDLTTSMDLAGNPEVIMYRAYVESIVTHSLMAFQNTEHEEKAPSKSLIDSYLTKNGLPIGQSGNNMFKGDKWFYDEIADRDPRLYANIDTTGLFLTGVVDVWAVSGYFGNRFVNESLKYLPGGRSSTCITDAPVMKYNEVLMNYIEAAAELATLGAYNLTQKDFDKTINVLRDRPSTSMPHVTLDGGQLKVNGVVINDPKRDQDVSQLLWEIRRERRVELVFEGIRFNDLRRWSKLNYADMSLNPDLNRGAWVDKDRYVQWYNAKYPNKKPLTVENLKGVHLDGGGNSGYILPIKDKGKMRTYSEKDYLYPLPKDQITLYESRGFKLPQNPGW